MTANKETVWRQTRENCLENDFLSSLTRSPNKNDFLPVNVPIYKIVAGLPPSSTERDQVYSMPTLSAVRVLIVFAPQFWISVRGMTSSAFPTAL